MGLFTTFSFAATGGTTNRTMPARLADIINVKDYGATGDGSTDDSSAIQAAFNAAYGPPGTPNANKWLNKGVYIPRGNYRIVTPLTLAPIGGSGGDAAGGWVFGDGQRNTRLFYAGSSTTALVTTQYMNYSLVQGITFDVTGSNAECAVHNSDLSPGTSGGTGVSWIDCAFVGATSWGILFDQASTGSEQMFVGCTFDGCTGSTSNIHDHLGNPIGGGLVLASTNALDHIVIGCRFTNNGCGILAIQGGVHLIKGCTFSNNAEIDIWIKQQNPATIVGCYSDSSIFCCVGPTWIAGCAHVTSGIGTFYDGTGVRFDQDNPIVTIEACYSPNSKLVANSGCILYLRGNTFSRADYLTGWAGPVNENI